MVYVDAMGHVRFGALKRDHVRKEFVALPSDFGRELKPTFAVSSRKSKGAPLFHTPSTAIATGRRDVLTCSEIATSHGAFIARTGTVTVRYG